MQKKTYILSLGGSIIVPNGIDVDFLGDFKKLILSEIKKNKRFILVAGGGKLARNYKDAAAKLNKLTDEDKDWMGIHCTRLNAHLLRTVFRDYAEPHINHNPTKKEKFTKPILCAAGWLPGCSTDYDAVLLAKQFKAKVIVNLSNIDQIYDKDPRFHDDAKKLEKMSWKELRDLVGDTWTPGANWPFDPVASKHAEKMKLKVVTMNGRNIKNFRAFLNDRKYIGTTIS